MDEVPLMPSSDSPLTSLDSPVGNPYCPSIRPFCVCVCSSFDPLTAIADGNSPNHNLQMYLHNIDPTRDVALMNKVDGVKRGGGVVLPGGDINDVSLLSSPLLSRLIVLAESTVSVVFLLYI